MKKVLMVLSLVAALALGYSVTSYANPQHHARENSSEHGSMKKKMKKMMQEMKMHHKMMKNQWKAKNNAIFLVFGKNIVKLDGDLNVLKKIEIPAPVPAEDPEEESKAENTKMKMKMKPKLPRKLDVTDDAVLLSEGARLLKFDLELSLLEEFNVGELSQ